MTNQSIKKWGFGDWGIEIWRLGDWGIRIIKGINSLIPKFPNLPFLISQSPNYPKFSVNPVRKFFSNGVNLRRYLRESASNLFSANQRRYPRSSAEKRAVTLIEILIAIAIVGMLSLGLAFMITSGLKVWTGSQSRTDIIDKGRVASERLSRELRQAVRNTMATWAANDIKFNVVLSGTTYVVEYKLVGTALQRSEKTSMGAADDFVNLANSVNNLNITYYDKDGATPAAAGDIRTVRVGLVMDMPAPEQDVTFETEVQLRNFKTTGE